MSLRGGLSRYNSLTVKLMPPPSALARANFPGSSTYAFICSSNWESSSGRNSDFQAFTSCLKRSSSSSTSFTLTDSSSEPISLEDGATMAESTFVGAVVGCVLFGVDFVSFGDTFSGFAAATDRDPCAREMPQCSLRYAPKPEKQRYL